MAVQQKLIVVILYLETRRKQVLVVTKVYKAFIIIKLKVAHSKRMSPMQMNVLHSFANSWNSNDDKEFMPNIFDLLCEYFLCLSPFKRQLSDS